MAQCYSHYTCLASNSTSHPLSGPACGLILLPPMLWDRQVDAGSSGIAQGQHGHGCSSLDPNAAALAMPQPLFMLSPACAGQTHGGCSHACSLAGISGQVQFGAIVISQESSADA